MTVVTRNVSDDLIWPGARRVSAVVASTKALGIGLLYKGDDFSQTDIGSRLPDQ